MRLRNTMKTYLELSGLFTGYVLLYNFLVVIVRGNTSIENFEFSIVSGLFFAAGVYVSHKYFKPRVLKWLFHKNETKSGDT